MNGPDINSGTGPWAGGEEDPPQGLVDETAHRIQQRIIQGELPVGTWLRQNRLATDLGVSRTPVREALRKLQAVGLVEVVPRRGALVRPLDARKLSDAFIVRAELEGLAAELAAELADDDQLERLQKAVAMFDESVEELDVRPVQSWEEATWRANSLIHEIILEAADNFCLTRSLEDPHLLVSSNVAWTTVLTRRTHILRRNMNEHHEIVDAIQQHDGAKARAAMRRHVLRTGEIVTKALRA
ncbi:GntR family transcriptional regulator (plasmid) [Pseudonocardia bannensis]|uniref:GntR family transcriptional regulator n=1 Tax=Pseudonocardia bannensis TaxID=630973 RepID=A0A848DNR6_9PSEU|nr:GntR family transcriptional regulator [Pseudonocardia bannensis]NMH94173.1 GntR family transcriptional regulator [Pseudonocardia bannensis]